MDVSEANTFFRSAGLWYNVFIIFKNRYKQNSGYSYQVLYHNNSYDFYKFYTHIKLSVCPHCNREGCLILHGFLYGYGDETGSGLIKRGRRIFCNNRKKRNGCGKTFSILKSRLIRNSMICADTLWAFLNRIKNGEFLAGAFRLSVKNMSKSSGYRLLRKFRLCQSRIRTRLNSIKDPPYLSINKPFVQTIIHLEEVFQECPISSFQYHFQAGFFNIEW